MESRVTNPVDTLLAHIARRRLHRMVAHRMRELQGRLALDIEKSDADTGQTLGVYGFGPGPYLLAALRARHACCGEDS